MPGQSDAAVAALPWPSRLRRRHCRAEGARFQHDVLIAILQSGASASRLARLSAVVPVPPRTIVRWRRWWRDTFTATPFWQIARAQLMPPVEHERLPASLLERFTVMPEACFQHVERDQLIMALRFIGPITGGTSR